MKHTTGPWHHAGYFGGEINAQVVFFNYDPLDGEGKAETDAGLCKVYNESHDKAIANAKLIAAAPDLLEACKIAVREIEILSGYEDNPKPFGKNHPAQYLKDAIRKAAKKETK